MEDRVRTEGVTSPYVGHNSLLVLETSTRHHTPVIISMFNVPVTVLPLSTSSSCLSLVVKSTSLVSGQHPVRFRSPLIVLQSLGPTTLDPDLTSLNCLVCGGGVESVSSRSLLCHTLTLGYLSTCFQSSVLASVDLVVHISYQLLIYHVGPGVTSEGEGCSTLDVARVSLLGMRCGTSGASVLSGVSVVDTSSAVPVS